MALRLGERPKNELRESSKRFVLGGTSRQNKCARAPRMHTVQNKLVALKKEKGKQRHHDWFHRTVYDTVV